MNGPHVFARRHSLANLRTLPTLLLAALVATACSTDLDPVGLEPGDASFFRGPPTDQHCADHQTLTKIEVPSGWDFGEDGPYVETVSVIDSTSGDPVDVIVTIDGGTVSFSSDDVELEDASFCIKGATNQTGTLNGLSGNTDDIPNRGGNAPDVSYVVLEGVTSKDDVTIEPCGGTLSVEGGFEIYEAWIEMGTNQGEFLFWYEALNQPDWYEIYYEGERIVNLFTGTRANDPFYNPLFLPGGRLEGAVDAEREAVFNGQRMVSFGSETSTSTQLFLRVTGSEPGTVWRARIDCPTT